MRRFPVPTIRNGSDAARAACWNRWAVHPDKEHHSYCTIELIAEGHAQRCPGEGCAFWDQGCVLTRIETELDGRAEVAQLLLDLRRELESGREITVDEARRRLDRTSQLPRI